MSKTRKKYQYLFIFFTIALLLVLTAEAVTYQRGSTGSVVSQIQTKLKNWGYYSGEVDGVYGSKTDAAVRSFSSVCSRSSKREMTSSKRILSSANNARA